VILCELCLIKNQFPKINNGDKTGEIRDGGGPLVSLLIEIKSVLYPVGFFNECFIEGRQMLRSFTVSDGCVTEHGELVE
jgi:hypothetical protein